MERNQSGIDGIARPSERWLLKLCPEVPTLFTCPDGVEGFFAHGMILRRAFPANSGEGRGVPPARATNRDLPCLMIGLGESREEPTKGIRRAVLHLVDQLEGM